MQGGEWVRREVRLRAIVRVRLGAAQNVISQARMGASTVRARESACILVKRRAGTSYGNARGSAS